MKFTNGIITFALAAAVLATGCEKEKIDFGGGQKPLGKRNLTVRSEGMK